MKLRSIVSLVFGLAVASCGQGSEDVVGPKLTYTRDGACSTVESFAHVIASAEVWFHDVAQLKAWEDAGIIVDGADDTQGLSAEVQLPNKSKKAVKIVPELVKLGGMPSFRRAVYRVQSDISDPTFAERVGFDIMAQAANLSVNFEDLRAGFEIEENYLDNGHSVKVKK